MRRWFILARLLISIIMIQTIFINNPKVLILHWKLSWGARNLRKFRVRNINRIISFSPRHVRDYRIRCARRIKFAPVCRIPIVLCVKPCHFLLIPRIFRLLPSATARIASPIRISQLLLSGQLPDAADERGLMRGFGLRFRGEFCHLPRWGLGGFAWFGLLHLLG